jgi:hypothetical protein
VRQLSLLGDAGLQARPEDSALAEAAQRGPIKHANNSTIIRTSTS